MIKTFIIFLLFLSTSLFGKHVDNETSVKAVDLASLKVHIFCEARSGLERDLSILKNALESLGCSVDSFNSDRNVTQADINIFCETLHPECFSKAKVNWFIPNPEWYTQERKLLNQIDLILCRTHEVDRIFSGLRRKTFFLGFTSDDHRDPYETKDFSSCLHLAGTSWQKGTEPLLDAWGHHPEFPQLNIIRFPENARKVPENVAWINQWMPEDELRALQNRCGLHLCLSETEGFGHYLMEAMAVGAVVVTTDAPPMNEFITDPRCLVPYKAWRKQKLGTNYYVEAAEIEEKMAALLKLPQSELKAIGKTNRRNYLKRQDQFQNRLRKLLKTKFPCKEAAGK